MCSIMRSKGDVERVLICLWIEALREVSGSFLEVIREHRLMKVFIWLSDFVRILSLLVLY